MPQQKTRSPKLPRSVQVLMVLALVLNALPLSAALAAPVSQDSVMVITFPSEGSTVSGQVDILGTATHPNFNSYGLLYATGARVTAQTDWQLTDQIAWDVRTQVVNGQLGTWDTTGLPNGSYVLALVVYGQGNETPQAHFVNNITVLNEETTPTPEPTATPNPEEPGEEGEGEGDAGPPPAAPTVVQPPTSTPRPTATLAAAAPGEGEEGGDDEGGLLPTDLFSVDAIKEAAKTGAQLSLLLYAIGMLYVLAKAAIRYYLRQQAKGDAGS